MILFTSSFFPVFGIPWRFTKNKSNQSQEEARNSMEKKRKTQSHFCPQTRKIRKVREPNREPGTEPREPETAQKPAVGKPNRTEPNR